MSTVTMQESVKITPDERSEILNQAIARASSRGWRVQSQSPTTAQLARGHRTNHILHLILAIITLGIWVPVWICVAVFGGEKHSFVSVDEYGNITER